MRRLLFAILFLAIPLMAATDASAGGCRIKRGCSACGAAYGYLPPVGYGAGYGYAGFAPPVYGYYSNPPIVVVAPAPVVYGYAEPRYYSPYANGYEGRGGYGYGYGGGYGYGYEGRGFFGYEGRGRGFIGARW